MSNNKFEHDPRYESHTDPYDEGTEPQEQESVVYPIEARDNLVRQIRSMEQIMVRNPDESVNVERTREERTALIAEQGLDKISEYDSNYSIGEDEQGLPVLKVK